MIDKYYSHNGNYPASLNDLENVIKKLRYSVVDCNYWLIDGAWGISVSSGFGIAIYESDRKKWFYD